ncbi:unnamed protein product, partial [Ascophyllum nodosum]
MTAYPCRKDVQFTLAPRNTAAKQRWLLLPMGSKLDHLTHRRPTLPRTFPCSASRRRAKASNGHRVEEEVRTLHASKGGRWSWAAYRAC